MLRQTSILAAAILLAAPAFAETKTFTVGAFDKLDISAGYDVIFTQSAQRSVTVESDDFSKVVVETRGDTLHVTRPRDNNYRSRKNEMDVVRISAPTLKAAEINAGVTFKAGKLTVGDLDLDINAGVEATFADLKAKRVVIDANAGVILDIAGECETLRVDAAAGAELRAKDFRCRDAQIDAQVGSVVRVHATDRLKADAGLGATVRVSGKPKSVEKHASMGGTISLD